MRHAKPSGIAFSVVIHISINFLVFTLGRSGKEKAMAPHSSTLAWKIPWMEEPGKLQSMGSLGVGHNWATSFTFHFHALEKEMATHLCSCLKNPKDGGAWWAAVYGVTQSWTRLKQCSSSSRSGKECRVQMTESQSKSSVGIINEDAG